MEFCGHDFADATLLAEALTTPSCRMADAAVRDNQRLEFLGDAVLGMIAAERLYAAMPGENEKRILSRITLNDILLLSILNFKLICSLQLLQVH